MDNNLIINSLDLQIKSMVEDIRKKKMLLSQLVLKRTDLSCRWVGFSVDAGNKEDYAKVKGVKHG